MKNYYIIFTLFSLGLLFTQCVDREFDIPPLTGPTVDIPEESIITIEEMLTQFNAGSNIKLPEGQFLRGTVVGSDRSGNIFKTLFIQDETAGIGVIVDETDLFNTFWVGREIFVDLTDLYLGDFNFLPQIGMAPLDGDLSRIPSRLVASVLTPGAFNVPVEPQNIRLGDVSNVFLNMLVQFDEVEFSNQELGNTYALSNPDENIFESVNREIVNCDGAAISLRTSGFSDFANTTVATGNGTLFGILGKFGNDTDSWQLTLRDLGDVNFDNNRCDGTTGGGTDIDPGDITDADIMTVADVKDLLVPGTATSLPSDKFIRGTVIANNGNGNFFRKVIVQDETGGIEVRIDDDNAITEFPIGSEVYVILGSLFIGEFNGLPQLGTNDGIGVGTISMGGSVLLATGNSGSATPKTITLDNLSEDDLSSLVQIEGVQFMEADIPGTYASDGSNGFFDLEDCDGNTLLVFTSSFSNYTNTSLPEGNGTFVAVLSAFSGDFQLILRDPNEVSMTAERCDGSDGGGGDGGGGTEDGDVSEDFEGGVNFDPVTISGWENVATEGERTWQVREFDGNLYAQATAFNDESQDMVTYLITPELNYDDITTLSFRSAQAFYTHGGLEVLFSNDYTGDADAATWVTVDAVLADENSAANDWVLSGDTDMSGFNGMGRIAFKYTGSGPNDLTNTFRIDDVVID